MNDGNMTPEQKAAWEKKSAETTVNTFDAVEDKVVGPVMEPSMPEVMSKISALMAEIETLKANQVQPATQNERADQFFANSGAQIGANGIQGVVQKYEIEKSHYEDPTDRLTSEPELSRFAMRENYVFKWDVEGVTYEKNNITYSEPRFVIELYRKLYDDEGEAMVRIDNAGNRIPQMALVNRNIFHQDEFAAKLAANRMGISDLSFDDLLNEYRYQVIKRWLVSLFKAPKVGQHGRQSKTMNIQGKMVEVFDAETLVDGDSGIDKANALKSQVGLGGIKV
jgi:hypothetical protein